MIEHYTKWPASERVLSELRIAESKIRRDSKQIRFVVDKNLDEDGSSASFFTAHQI